MHACSHSCRLYLAFLKASGHFDYVYHDDDDSNGDNDADGYQNEYEG